VNREIRPRRSQSNLALIPGKHEFRNPDALGRRSEKQQSVCRRHRPAVRIAPAFHRESGGHPRAVLKGSVVENHIEQRFMNPNATVVFNKAELSKTIHKKTDAGPSGPDHFRKRFLCDLRNQ